MQALSEQNVVAYRILGDIGVQSGTLYFCTGQRFLYDGTNTYTPVGGFGDVEDIVEETDAFPRDVTLSLSAFSRTGSYTIGLDPTEPVQEGMFKRPVTLRGVFLDVPTGMITVAPERRFDGKIEEINLDINNMSFSLRCVTEVRDTAPIQFFNRETIQLLVDSSDTFADHVDQIPLARGKWGADDPSIARRAVDAARGAGNAAEAVLDRFRTRRG